MESTDQVAGFYNRSNEDARLDRHPLEWAMTWRHLEDVLPSSGKVLEVGCATGRYSLEFARRGYEVVGLDIEAGHIEKANVYAQEQSLSELAAFAVGDAQDLSRFADGSFDLVLLSGPLYHLREKEARKLAIQEAYRVLRKGGTIGTTFISRYGMLGDLLVDQPKWALSREVEPILNNGHVPVEWSGFPGYFALDDEAIGLHEDAGFSTVRLSALEPAVGACEFAYNELSPEL